MKRILAIEGMGVVTDRYASIEELAQECECAAGMGETIERATVLDAGEVVSLDAVAQLAVRAIHQARGMAGMAGMEKAEGQGVGLLFQTSWGMIDATAAYLESMLADGGKYASPRHFSRSVYSSAASLAAIHFGVRGPCETLAFEREIVSGPLRQAWRLLKARRCERVIVVWAEQGGEVAEDLVKRAARGLMRRDYERYIERGVGFGAVAVVVGLERGNCEVDVDALANVGEMNGKAFAMEGAVGFLRGILEGRIR